MEQVEIRIGKKTSDLRIEHFRVINDIAFVDAPTVNDMIQTIHLYSGVKVAKIKQFTLKQIAQMYGAIANQFAGLKVDEAPPKELTFNGVEYCLIDPEKVGIGWHQDFSNCNINEPLRLASMFYLPKGVIYGDEDENGNLISSIRDRSPIFKEHMELQVFISCCAFFLRRYERLTRISTVKQRASNLSEKIVMKLKRKR